MKQLIGIDTGSYAFDKDLRTITFSDVSLSQEQILLITNTTDQIIIYSFADTNIGGSLVGSVLTLEYDTTSMSNTDKLQIYVDVPTTEEFISLLKTGDTTYKTPVIDVNTHSTIMIEIEHSKIHSGYHYNYCDYQLNNASAATIKFIVTTPNTTNWVHLTFMFYSSDGATIQLYKDASGVTGGTSITPRNNNRNSLNTSPFTIIKDPTSVTSIGTRASGFLAGAGKEAGMTQRDKENILKQNTTYYLLITSLAVANDISWCFEWYENINKTA
jgi:hypothetical protein